MFIQNKAKEQHLSTSASQGSGRPLTAIKSNAIRYMAGYMAVHLFKKYKTTKNAELKVKWNYFVRVQKGMKATDQAVDSVLDYTRVWSDEHCELVDRGGLYHISDDVDILS